MRIKKTKIVTPDISIYEPTSILNTLTINEELKYVFKKVGIEYKYQIVDRRPKGGDEVPYDSDVQKK